MTIILVIPTYNEAENLPILAKAIFDLGIKDLQILVVDDNSPDGCGDVADGLHTQYGNQFRVIHRQNKQGLGKAYIQGLDWALKHDADVIGMMDADLSHPPEKLVEMLATLEHADLVIGSRYVEGGSLDDHWPIWRKFLSWFGNTYARIILGLPIKDATGAYRLWQREALEIIPFRDSKSNGYVFIIELAYLAKLNDIKIKEVPIHFVERENGYSKMSLWIQIEAAFRVWKLRQVHKKPAREKRS